MLSSVLLPAGWRGRSGVLDDCVLDEDDGGEDDDEGEHEDDDECSNEEDARRLCGEKLVARRARYRWCRVVGSRWAYDGSGSS